MRDTMMLRLLVGVTVLLAGRGAGAATPPSEWEPARTYAMVVGVLEWKQSGLAWYPKEGRQDAALVEQLKARGVASENIVFVKDQDATLANIRKELSAIAERSGAGSTLVFYFAGHGTCVGEETYFLNYEVDTSKCAETALGLGEVAATLKNKWKGSTLLLMADCCHSGGLEAVVKAFEGTGGVGGAGVRAAMITSADVASSSTNNWTFTESMVAALGGSREGGPGSAGAGGPGAVDLNRDGVVTLHEAGEFVHKEMRWKERQTAAAARTSNFPAEFVLSRASESQRLARLEGAWQIKDYAEVEVDGRTRAVQIEGMKDGKYRVRMVGGRGGGGEERVVGTEELKRAAARHEGEKVRIEWRGNWYPGRLAGVNGDGKYRVRYDGYGAEWDEWVAAARVRRGER